MLGRRKHRRQYRTASIVRAFWVTRLTGGIDAQRFVPVLGVDQNTEGGPVRLVQLVRCGVNGFCIAPPRHRDSSIHTLGVLNEAQQATMPYIGKIERLFDFEIEADDFTTIAGLMIGAAGHVPRTGERLTFRGLDVEVLEADDKRIARLRLRRFDEPTALSE